MKKLNKISLKSSRLLSDKEMKQVFGGSGSSGGYITCGALCKTPEGYDVSLPLTCYGGCGFKDYEGVWCIDEDGKIESTEKLCKVLIK